MLSISSLEGFIEQLADNTPTPGGGSASAASGAMAAALVQMVAKLTISKKKYSHLQDELGLIITHAEDLQNKLLLLVAEDASSFNEVMKAYRLPRETEEDKQKRKTAIQIALKNASLTPLITAQYCAEVISLCHQLLNLENLNTISDLGVAALCANTGLRGASLNVEINLCELEDDMFIKHTKQKISALVQENHLLFEKIINEVQQKITAP